MDVLKATWHRSRCQHYGNTPKPVWNPDVPSPIDFREGWTLVPEQVCARVLQYCSTVHSSGVHTWVLGPPSATKFLFL